MIYKLLVTLLLSVKTERRNKHTKKKMMDAQLKEDFETLQIDGTTATITVKLVTTKYRKLAKQRHPDREGGSKVEFQDLQNAYKRIIKYLERTQEDPNDYEKEFFMRNNVCKECTTSFVVYIQNREYKSWKTVLEKHLDLHRDDEKKRVIFKTGIFTVTLYDMPRIDLKSKIHIQSSDQQANIEFIMDKLSAMYQEVVFLENLSAPTLKLKNGEKSLCGKCGKQFTNKKGVKQHMIRMHTNRREKTKVDAVTLDEIVSPDKLDSMKVVGVKANDVTVVFASPSPTETSKPAPKKMTNCDIIEIEDDSSEVELKNSMEKHFSQIIKNLLDEAVDRVTEKIDLEELLIENEEENIQIDTNYQCGLCGKLFETEENVNTHIDHEHMDEEQCLKCKTYENEEIVLMKIITEKEELILSANKFQDNLTSKNVALDRENKRLKLALKQSEFEKQALKKEIEVQRETLDAALKENTVLNETINLKEDLAACNDGNVTEKNDSSKKDKDAVDDDIEIVEETLGQKQKCKDCDFETCVPKYIKSHRMKHTTGQYQCQRGEGCKLAFKSWKELDDHIKSIHSQKKPDVATSFNCDVCKHSFDAKAKLRIHVEKNHAKGGSFKCENCGKVFTTQHDRKEHMDKCNQGFETIKTQSCRFYANGICIKGDSCSFLHQPNHQPNYSTTPHCRNGLRCGYFANGVCSFFHPGVGVQRPRLSTSSGYKSSINQQMFENNHRQNRGWCRFLEDCTRVPNCPFIHHEEDFPPLGQNNPPENTRNQRRTPKTNY